MDITEWMGQLAGDELAHIEDSIRTGEFEIMKVTATRFAVVTIEADQRSIEVFQQADGKFKCLSCQRYRCEHVAFVKTQNVEMPKHAPVTAGDDDEILTY